MIIGPDSPLRSIPAALDRKQAFFLEGIRGSVEMIEVAHRRLQATLLEISNGFVASAAMPPQELLASIILDAWAIVDCFHRLTDLAQHMPNVQGRNKSPEFRNLVSDNQTVNEMRNTVQHLPEQVHEMQYGPEWSIWGALSWCVPPETPEGRIDCFSYVCGKLESAANRPLVNPLGRRIHRPIGLITLTQHPHAICISELVETVQKFSGKLEEILAASFAADSRLAERHAADLLVYVTMMAEEEKPANPLPQQP